MKKLLLLMVICGIIATVPSCSNKSSSSTTTGIPEWAGTLMQTVPDDVLFAAFLDIETLRTDPDLQAYFTDRQNWFYTSSFFSQDLFDFNQLEYWVSCTYGALITGHFDIETAQSSLLNNGWIQGEYEDFTVFGTTDTWGQILKIAFGHEYVIGGSNASVDTMIRTINGEQQSIYEDSQFQGVMALLPSSSFELSYGDNYYTASDDSSIRLIAGNAISKLDDDYLRYTYIVTAPYETISEAVIEDLINDLKNYSDAFAQTEMEATRSGSYVTITTDIPISSFSNGSSTSQ